MAISIFKVKEAKVNDCIVYSFKEEAMKMFYHYIDLVFYFIIYIAQSKLS